MTTNLLSVIEKQQKALAHAIEWLNICDKPRECMPLHAALAAGKQALEQTQGEDDYKRGFADGMKEAPTGEYWIRAIDEAMVGAHLGVADMADDYGTAKKKLNDLICWSVQVDRDLSQATEPAPSNQQDNRFYREKSTEQTPSTELPGMWDTSDFTGGATDMPAPSTAVERAEVAKALKVIASVDFTGAWPGSNTDKTRKTIERAAALLSAPALPVGERTTLEQIAAIDPRTTSSALAPHIARLALAAASTQPAREPPAASSKGKHL